MRTTIVVLALVIFGAAGNAAADTYCLCPAELPGPILRHGLTGVPRNARFFTVGLRNDLYVGTSTTHVPVEFVPAPGGAGLGWLVPVEPLAANQTYTFQGRTFTTGEAFDTTPPAFSGLRSSGPADGGCGTHATRILEALGYSDDASELAGGVIMKVSLRRAGDGAARTVYVPAADAVIAAFEDRDPCANVSWEDHDASFVATVTLIDLAGNESAPSAEVTFGLDLVAGEEMGCVVGGGAPAAPLAGLLAALLAWRARRRGTPRA